MVTSRQPEEPPPTYEAATSTASSSDPTPGIRRVSTDGPAARLERNGIAPDRRRSMEDELRELPPGWVRSFDPESHHQFFVDTRAEPPRSIWVHPYDDDDFLNTLSPEERKQHTRMRRTMTLEDLAAEDSDDDHHAAQLPPRPGARNQAPATGEAHPKGLSGFSRKLKDKLTGQTHAEREAARVRRAEAERQAYLAHVRARQAMLRAIETGEPQLLGKDGQGRDVYVEPPHGPYVQRPGYGYSPYSNNPYQNANMRYMRPAVPYGRPYGYGYGGGAGLPIAAGILGGAMLGGALF